MSLSAYKYADKLIYVSMLIYNSPHFRLVRVPLILVDVLVGLGISASIIGLLFVTSSTLKLHLKV